MDPKNLEKKTPECYNFEGNNSIDGCREKKYRNDETDLLNKWLHCRTCLFFFLSYFSTVWAQHCCIAAMPEDWKAKLVANENTTLYVSTMTRWYDVPTELKTYWGSTEYLVAPEMLPSSFLFWLFGKLLKICTEFGLSSVPLFISVVSASYQHYTSALQLDKIPYFPPCLTFFHSPSTLHTSSPHPLLSFLSNCQSVHHTRVFVCCFWQNAV